MSESIEHIRQTARQLAERLKTDPAFRTQIELQPETTLIAAGLPEEAVPDFLHETQVSDEVSAYSVCCITCVTTPINTTA